MPRLLRAIVIVMIVALAFDGIWLAWSFFHPGSLRPSWAIATVVGMNIRFFVIRGLIRRTPLAWTWARIFSLLSIVITIFVLAVIAWSAPLLALFRMAGDIIPLAISVFVFIALGQPSVRECFRSRSV